MSLLEDSWDSQQPCAWAGMISWCLDQSECVALGASGPNTLFRDGLGTGQSTGLRRTGRKTPVLSIPGSRAVILLGINPTVHQTLQHVISQGAKLVPQSEGDFQGQVGICPAWAEPERREGDRHGPGRAVNGSQDWASCEEKGWHDLPGWHSTQERTIPPWAAPKALQILHQPCGELRARATARRCWQALCYGYGTYCKCMRLLRLQHHPSWAIYESVSRNQLPGSGEEPEGIEGFEDLL